MTDDDNGSVGIGFEKYCFIAVVSQTIGNPISLKRSVQNVQKVQNVV